MRNISYIVSTELHKNTIFVQVLRSNSLNNAKSIVQVK